MRIILVEDNPIILRGELELIQRCVPGAELQGFSNPQEALAYAETAQPDTAFLDIDLGKSSGVDLARQLKRKNHSLNIIFCTAYDSFYREAVDLRASGYLLKPVSEDALREELDNLRYPPARKSGGLFVRAFGSFEVFYHNEPLLFHYQKTKELFAYLIDRRGAVVTRDELVTILWGGEEEHNSYFKQIQKDLKDTLASVGQERVLVKQRGALGLRMREIHCDYYEWLAGRPEGINAYRGEYMRQYDWGEPTYASLEGKSMLWIP